MRDQTHAAAIVRAFKGKATYEPVKTNRLKSPREMNKDPSPEWVHHRHPFKDGVTLKSAMIANMYERDALAAWTKVF